MHRKFIKPIIGLLVAGILPVAVSAGPIFIPGKLDGDTFTPGANAGSSCYSIRYSSIKAEISGGIAKVRLLETVTGPASPVETACIIPLPEAIAGDDAAVVFLDADGKETPVAGAKLLSVAAAQALYESVAKGIGRTELLSLSGRPALAVPTFMLHGEMEFAVTFRQRVENRDGIQSIHLPTPVLHCASGVVGRLTAEVALTAEKPLRTIFSPSHDITVVRDGLTKAVVRAKCDRWAGNADLRLFWVADADELGLRVLASRPEKDEDGYFMLLGNPTGSKVAAKPVARDVIFVLDTSGSMRGEKIEQARAAMEYCLGRLNPDDRFNIITFGSKVSPFREVPIDVSAKNVAAARTFIEDIVAEGGTNISGALAVALTGEATPDRPRLAIFLTDGAPTDGELIPDKIIEGVKKENGAKTQIFVFGVGNDVNAHLLDRLAEETDGSSEYVKPKEEIDAKVAVLYDRLANPVLADIGLAFGELQTSSVYPRKLPALFRGSEIMVFGRYRNGGQHTFTVSGQLAGKALSYSCTAQLPETAAPEAGTEFVAPIWAARAIGFLLQEIRLRGRNDELIAEVVRLSRRYGIVTEYTEFIAAASKATEKMSDKELVAEVKNRMESANGIQSGGWAVNQACNDRDMQTRVNASMDANSYVDRRGSVVKAETIRQVGGQVFYLRDGQWVDAAAPGSRKVRNIALNSADYQNLIRSSRDFAQAQQLGWAVAMNVGDERIVVEKDGKQQDEELKKLAPPPEPEQDNQQMFNQQMPRINQAPNMRNIPNIQNIPNNNLQQNGATE
jgi:uncharacterized protein YegL